MFKKKLTSFLIAFCLFSFAAEPEQPALDEFQQVVKIQADKVKEKGYDVQVWLNYFYKGDYRAAGHLWTSIQLQIPEKLRDTADAAQLYSLWKLEVPQTFVDAWLLSLPRKSFQQAKTTAQLEKAIAPGMRAFLEGNGIFFTKDQETTIRSLPSTPLYNELKAWNALKRGIEARGAMEALPDGHPWKVPLAKTVSLAIARQGKLDEAVKLLEKQIASIDSAAYHLQLARFAYQKGDLETAEKWYEKIPKDTEEYLSAREELLWVWLRLGNSAKLRGNLASLSLPLFEDRFAPELYVVRAISNLKLCQYESAHKDFSGFIKNNGKWASQIQSSIQSDDPAAPPQRDWYIQLVETALESRTVELRKVKNLHAHSLAAALPAVGKQLHWEKAEKNLVSMQNRLAKVRAQEYRRQWKNSSVMVREAIRKMQFVKIELMTQLRQGLKGNPDSQGSKVAQKKADEIVVSEMNQGEMNFPFDGVVWPDELFQLRSNAASQCL